MKRTRTKTTIGVRAFAAVQVLAAVLAGGQPESARDKGKQQESGAFAIIAGTVFRESGFSLPGAEVTLTQEPGDDGRKLAKAQRQTTDARGEFAFRVPAERARYRVTASAKRFEKQEKTVEIQGEERADVTLTLPQSSNR
jgi:hypothetical protein